MPKSRKKPELRPIRRTGRIVWGCVLLVLTVFLLLSVGSWGPSNVWFSDYPRGDAGGNICGPVGAFLGSGARSCIGTAAYPLLLLTGVLSVFLLIGRPIRELRTKIISGVVFLVSWACLADLPTHGAPPGAVGPGGILGHLLNKHVLTPCGWGAWLIATALFLGSLFFLTEMAPLALSRMAWSAWRTRRFRRTRLKGIIDAGPEPLPEPASADAAFRSEAPATTRPPETQPITTGQPASDTSSAPPPFEHETPTPLQTPAQRAPETLQPAPDEDIAFTEAETELVARPRRGTTPETTWDAPTVDLGRDAEESCVGPPRPVETDAGAGGPQDSEPGEPAEEPGEPDVTEPGEPEADEPPPADAADEPEEPAAPARPRRNATRPRGPQPASEAFALSAVDLLDSAERADHAADDEAIQGTARRLENCLAEFNVDAQVVEVDRGPVITMYEIELAPGVKIGKVVNLADDIARALSATSVRIVAPIPGKSTVGIEVPNAVRETVCLRDLFESGVLDRKQLAIPILIGKDASGQPLVADLAQMPHCLIAGATGTGKSVCINALIASLLMTQRPDQLKLILIDPKMVEFVVFKDIPHLMAPVVMDMKKATAVLEWATYRMDQRFEFLSAVGARNIVAFNDLGEAGVRERLGAEPDADLGDFPVFLPYIVIIIDELADLMMTAKKEVENHIIRVAQKARAVGIHLIIATQRPSVDVITGLIKANMPSRIALKVASKVDSRTILDRNGAESLLGMGDMLFLPPGTSKLTRAQGSFVSDVELRRIVERLREQARPVFDDELIRQRTVGDQPPWERDELFVEAVRIIVETGRGSVSLLQRQLTIGYTRAARLVDMMAEMRLVGEYKGSQAREVLVTAEEWENMLAEFEQDSE